MLFSQAETKLLNMTEKKTKIICTISDINCETEFIRNLYLNGMNVARINSAHATIEGAQRVVDNIRSISDKIAILIDTKGPEVRLTGMSDGIVGFAVKEGDILAKGERIGLCGSLNIVSPSGVFIMCFIYDVAVDYDNIAGVALPFYYPESEE